MLVNGTPTTRPLSRCVSSQKHTLQTVKSRRVLVSRRGNLKFETSDQSYRYGLIFTIYEWMLNQSFRRNHLPYRVREAGMFKTNTYLYADSTYIMSLITGASHQLLCRSVRCDHNAAQERHFPRCIYSSEARL